MASKTKSIVKAFIDVGKVDVVENGKTKQEQQYLVVSEELAKFVGAKYTTTAPPITVTTKAGKTYKREVSINNSGVKYQFGYVDGTTGKGKAKKAKIKWISIYIPYNVKLRPYIASLIKQIKKKPIFLKMPSGQSNRLFDSK